MTPAEAGREWARQHPLTDQQKQRIWTLLDESRIAVAS